MKQIINETLDRISEYLAHRKGLLPLIGILLVVVNLILQFIPSIGWLTQSNTLLHVGVIIALLGFLIAWAL